VLAFAGAALAFAGPVAEAAALTFPGPAGGPTTFTFVGLADGAATFAVAGPTAGVAPFAFTCPAAGVATFGFDGPVAAGARPAFAGPTAGVASARRVSRGGSIRGEEPRCETARASRGFGGSFQTTTLSLPIVRRTRFQSRAANVTCQAKTLPRALVYVAASVSGPTGDFSPPTNCRSTARSSV
jgi:hypothetical protein